MLFKNETILTNKTIISLFIYYSYYTKTLLEKILRVVISLIMLLLTLLYVKDITDKILNISASLYVIYQTVIIQKGIRRGCKIKYTFYNDSFSMSGANSDNVSIKYEEIENVDNTKKYCYIIASNNILIIDNSKFTTENSIKFKKFLEHKIGEIEKMRKYKKVEIGDDVIYKGKNCKVIAKAEEKQSVILVSVETNEKIETEIENIELMGE